MVANLSGWASCSEKAHGGRGVLLGGVHDERGAERPPLAPQRLGQTGETGRIARQLEEAREAQQQQEPEVDPADQADIEGQDDEEVDDHRRGCRVPQPRAQRLHRLQQRMLRRGPQAHAVFEREDQGGDDLDGHEQRAVALGDARHRLEDHRQHVGEDQHDQRHMDAIRHGRAGKALVEDLVGAVPHGGRWHGYSPAPVTGAHGPTVPSRAPARQRGRGRRDCLVRPQPGPPRWRRGPRRPSCRQDRRPAPYRGGHRRPCRRAPRNRHAPDPRR